MNWHVYSNIIEAMKLRRYLGVYGPRGAYITRQFWTLRGARRWRDGLLYKGYAGLYRWDGIGAWRRILDGGPQSPPKGSQS
jgi:hypothetical protein